MNFNNITVNTMNTGKAQELESYTINLSQCPPNKKTCRINFEAVEISEDASHIKDQKNQIAALEKKLRVGGGDGIKKTFSKNKHAASDKLYCPGNY